MAQYNFGVGTLIAKRTDLSLVKPAYMGVLQEVELSLDRELKTLVGQYNVAEAIAGGELKITAKAKFARIQATNIANVFSDALPVAGITTMAQGETGPLVTHARTVSHSATFVEDLGVFDAATGVQLQPVGATPAVGEYTVAAGVYTFNAAETVANVTIYYTYTTAGAAAGYTQTLSKQLMGPIPTFALFLTSSFAQFGITKSLTVKLNAVTSGKLTFPFKNKDFTIQDMEMQAFCDASGNWGTISTSE